MAFTVLKVIGASIIITGSAWVARINPRIGGFILALPLTTLIALAFNYGEFQNAQASTDFARSTFYAVPISLLFFLPFLFADRLKLGFWGLYWIGIGLLGIGYGIHKGIMSYLERSL